MTTKKDSFVGAELPPIVPVAKRLSPGKAPAATALTELDIDTIAAMAQEMSPFLTQRRVIIKRIDVAEEVFREITAIAQETGVHKQSVVNDLIIRGLAAYRFTPTLIRPTMRFKSRAPKLPTAHTRKERPTLGAE